MRRGFGSDGRRQETTMQRQQFTRRIVLGAFALTLALPGLGARAAEDDGGFYDKAQFKGTCEEFGGIFTDTQDGNTWCQWDDDSQTVCDEDGQDCHDIPRTTQTVAPIDAPLVAVDETQTVAPVAAPLEAIAETEIMAPVETQAVSAAESGALAAPVDVVETAVEEAIPAATSAEQP
jgi:hypothetical protein